MIKPALPRPAHQEIFVLLVLIAAVVVIGIVSFITRIETAGSTAPNGKYFFDPAVAEIEGCKPFSTDVKIQLTDGRSSAADLFISYDPKLIQVLNVTPGKAYQLHAVNQHDPNAGTITINGLNLIGDGFQGTDIFVNIRFKSLPGTKSAGFTIKFNGIGDTLDSNIADSQTSLDLLQQVTNADYTFSNPTCKAAPTPPAPPVKPPTSPNPPPPANPSTDGSNPPPVTPPANPNPPTPPSAPRLSLSYVVSVRGSSYDPNEIPDITFGETFRVVGKTQPEQKVEVLISSSLKLSTTSNKRGEWAFEIDTDDLRVGSQTIQARTYASEGRFLFSPVSGFYVVGEGADGRQRPAAAPGLTKEDRNIAVVVATAGVFVTSLGFLLTVQLKEIKVLIRGD